jgi:LuxR family maltose regulon positive regulatory protein
VLAPILTTKLYIPPPRDNVVVRTRLIERLNEGLRRKLTLVSAPAGFGKTTLVSEWIATLTPSPLPGGEGLAVRVAWLSLDEGDNEPARFLAYFVAAVQTIAAKVGTGVLAILQSPQPPPIEAILTSLVNDITTVPDNFVLVLDDYHVIEDQPVNQALTFLVEHLPSQMHLLIATREDPPLPLARLRVRGQLTELRAADLRFTPAEAAGFLNQVMGLNLTAEDIAVLENRTEGWIAGLQLAALSLQGQADATRFIQAFTGSHHFVLDYLIEEVLRRQSESVQIFLLQTSILERLCGPLCEAVLLTPAGFGQETLKYLERANLFIVPLDNERHWYRYHRLFADLLRQRLGQSSTPEKISEYHIRASQWHEQNGDEAAAFQHAIAARDFGRAAGLAELAWRGMDGTFQLAAWLSWVKQLPDDVIGIRPVLSTQYAWALMDTGAIEACESHLRHAERCLAGSSDEMIVVEQEQFESLPAMIALARAYVAQVQGNFAATVKYAELALQLIPQEDLFRRAQAIVTLEFTHWASGDLEAAHKAMNDWMSSMQQAGNIVFVVASAFALADIQVAQGHLREAVRTYQQSLQLAAESGPEAQAITAHHYLGLALLYHEMNHAEAFAQHWQKAEELGQRTTLVDWPYRWCLAQARLKQDEGELDVALELLDEAQRVYVRNPAPDLHPSEALKTQVYLKQGRLAKAQEWARERGLSADDEISYLREFEHMTLARILIAEYQTTQVDRSILEAVDLLSRLLKTAEVQRRTGSVIAILVMQALAHQAQGNLPAARAALERALTLTEPEGYVRIFVDEGAAMRLLILDFRFWIEKQGQSESRRLSGYTTKLLTAFEQAAAVPQSKIQNPKSEFLEPLSPRELEVLRLIAQGLSNQEIADRLFLAVSTVKGYTRAIFDKLQVQRRTEAAARARELGLL